MKGDKTPPISGNFGEKAGIDPHTAKEIHLHGEVRKFNDPEALGELNKLSQQQKKSLERVKIDQDKSRRTRVSNWVRTIIDEARTKLFPALRPKHTPKEVRSVMNSIVRDQAVVHTLFEDKKEIEQARDRNIGEQRHVLAKTLSKDGRKQFNKKGRKPLSIDFNLGKGRRR